MNELNLEDIQNDLKKLNEIKLRLFNEKYVEVLYDIFWKGTRGLTFDEYIEKIMKDFINNELLDQSLLELDKNN